MYIPADLFRLRWRLDRPALGHEDIDHLRGPQADPSLEVASLGYASRDSYFGRE